MKPATMLFEVKKFAARQERQVKKTVERLFNDGKPLDIKEAMTLLVSREESYNKEVTGKNQAELKLLSGLLSTWQDILFLQLVSMKQASRLFRGETK